LCDIGPHFENSNWSGQASRRDLLFQAHTIDQVNAISTRCLWHKHLGHPSSELVSLLPSSLAIISGSNTIKEEACEICLLVKQTRNCFPVSTNNTTTIFN